MKFGEMQSANLSLAINPDITRTINFTSSMTAAQIQALIDGVWKYIPYGQTITFQFAGGLDLWSNSGRADILYNYFYAAGKAGSLQAGIRVAWGRAEVQSNYVSNTYYGIQALGESTILSNNNDDTGTAPTYGLASITASTIGKTGTQPAGSTANELAQTGGVIRA